MWSDSLQRELEEVEARGLRRAWKRVEEVEGGRVLIEGRWRIHLASNNYLGLSLHPRVIAAARDALERFGTGAGSARLIAGTFAVHEALEEKIAVFKQAEASLLFPTGYMANLGIVSTLVGPGDLILSDHLNHASLIDACRLSRALLRVYPHKDLERLERALKHRAGKFRRVLILTEGLFSMDGDIAPLPGILELARHHGAWLLIDEAHATGVLGGKGRGSLEHFGISSAGSSGEAPILQMGTLSKALGSLGGFLAGPRVVIELLKNKARPFIYATALPPASAAAALEALRVVEEEPIWRDRLWQNVRRWIAGLRELGLDLVSEESPIVSVRIGGNQETMKTAQALLEAGIYAPGIRPPTVPAGSARIRTSLTALHTEQDLEEAIKFFKNEVDCGTISRFLQSRNSLAPQGYR